MSNAFDLNIDVTELDDLAQGFRQLTGDVLGQAALGAVNAVAEQFDRDQRHGQNEGINLSDGYISGRTTFTPATSAVNPRATVVTSGALTRMGTYDPVVRRDPERRDKRGHRIGKRQAGVTVSIKRGQPEYHFSWFVMPLKGTGGKLGVFVRGASGKAEHLYAVAPYSLARFQAKTRQAGVEDELQAQGAAAIADAIQRAIA